MTIFCIFYFFFRFRRSRRRRRRLPSTTALRDGRQHGHGTVDTYRQQAPGRVHTAGRAHAAGPAADRGGRRPERRQEFRAGELCREVRCPPRSAGTPTVEKVPPQRLFL